MLEVERELWRSPIPTPLLKAGDVEQVMGTEPSHILDISKDGDPITSVGTLFLSVTTLTVKNCILMF